ncbi:MAG: AAA family ATPase [Paracoccaceae bacterium]
MDNTQETAQHNDADGAVGTDDRVPMHDAAHTRSLQAQCRAIMESEKLSQEKLAAESGIARGTFTAWMGGTYSGRMERVSGRVEMWLNAREAHKAAVMKVPRAPGFVPTPSTLEFMDSLRFAHTLPDIALIVGPPGIGKTMAAMHYRDITPNVLMITASPATSKGNTILRELAGALGIVHGMPAALYERVLKELERNRPLIIVDEVQHLEMQALEQLRSIHDRLQVGLALLGNETVHSRITSGINESAHAQLISRVGFRIRKASANPRDVDILIDAWGIERDAEAAETLRLIAKRAGALRVMTKVLQLASVIASGEKETRGKAHIIAAYQQLSSNGGRL